MWDIDWRSVINGLICFGSPVSILVLLTYIAGAISHRSWKRFAKQEGLKFLPIRLWRSRNRIEGIRAGHSISIYFQIGDVEEYLQQKSSLYKDSNLDRRTVVKVSIYPQQVGRPEWHDSPALKPHRERILQSVQETQPIAWIYRDQIYIAKEGHVHKESELKELLDEAVLIAQKLSTPPA